MWLFYSCSSVLQLLDTLIQFVSLLNLNEITLCCCDESVPFILNLLMLLLAEPANVPVILYSYQSSYIYYKSCMFSQS